MKLLLQYHALLAVAVAGCSGLSRGSPEPVGEVRAAVAAGGAQTIIVRNNIGSITVKSAAGDTVSVRAAIHYRGGEAALGRKAAAEDLRVERSADSVIVENTHLEDETPEDWRTDIEVAAPASMDLRVHDGLGDCTVDGLQGRISVRLGVGKLHVSTARLRGASLHVGNGPLRLAVTEALPEGDVLCESGRGDMRIKVPGTFQGSVALYTGIGAITIRGAEAIRVRRTRPAESARGRLGDAPAEVTAGTGVGDLEFTRS